jgi:hypothetical protein
MRYSVRRTKSLVWLFPAVFLVGLVAGCGQWTTAQWYRGNTHTHTWWSDGDSPPETVVKWYKDHGYNFLVLSDHNVLSEGQKWVVADKKRGPAARLYEKNFGPDQVVKRQTADGQTEYLCAPLTKVKAMYEKPERFLLVPGEEISDSAEGKPVHMNGVNLAKVVAPLHGATVFDALQNDVNAVFAQEAKTGQPMLVHVNHPNFGWALRAEDLARLAGPVFFEVGNGHPGVNNLGDDTYMSAERMWDVALTKRLAEYELPIMYGFATDDGHSFTSSSPHAAGPGRGWVVVRAHSLSASSLVSAMYRGDFYASTGVKLREVRFADGRLDIEIEPEPGVSYTTQFIGTLEGYDDSLAYLPSDPRRGLTCRYSGDIGRVLSEQAGTEASYRLTGREIYVRAKVTSTAKHMNPVVAGEFQVAWVQPVRLGGPRIGVR